MSKRTPASKSARSFVKGGSQNPSIAQLEAQIAELQRQAEEVRRSEIADVVARIREAIAHYGLTAADLGLAGGGKRRGQAGSGRIKYRDEAGHAWSGHGRRPQWFIDALAAGKTEADLRA